MPTFHDVSLPISEALVTYPGDPGIELAPHARIAAGDDVNVTRLAFGSHTGTHVDAPHHFIDGARRVDDIPLDVLIGPARVVEIPADVRAIGAGELERAGIDGVARLLLKTCNARLLDRDGFQQDFAYLTGDAARLLVDAGVRLVGIDYLSIEEYGAAESVAHETLLGADVVVVEGVDLRRVAGGDYELICLPLRLAGADGAPARVVLKRE
jgi:arylformamidase